MSSSSLYMEINRKNIKSIRKGNNECDEFLSARRPDSRLGISLIIPIKEVKTQYTFLVNDFSRIEPEQYYYPFEDLHITVFDFIQGSENYQTNKSLESLLITISKIALSNEKAFNIKMKGVAFSNAAGMVTGYDKNKLVFIRETIRKIMKDYKLRNDERYISKSSHVTFMRFKRLILRTNEMCKMIKEYENKYFGIERISELQLVEHDWYNTTEKKRIIERIEI